MTVCDSKSRGPTSNTEGHPFFNPLPVFFSSSFIPLIDMDRRGASVKLLCRSSCCDLFGIGQNICFQFRLWDERDDHNLFGGNSGRQADAVIVAMDMIRLPIKRVVIRPRGCIGYSNCPSLLLKRILEAFAKFCPR